MSFPPGTEMFQFPGFALKTLCVQELSTCLTRLIIARRQSIVGYQVGCPIRRSADQRVLSPPHGLSQSATSFIASCRQGIHQTPLLRLIRSRRRKTLPRCVHRSEPAPPRPVSPIVDRLAPARSAAQLGGSRPHLPISAAAAAPRQGHATALGQCSRLGKTCVPPASPAEAEARIEHKSRVPLHDVKNPRAARRPPKRAKRMSSTARRPPSSPRPDPDHRPHPAKPSPRVVVGVGGLEPPTLRLSGVRSNHLSYTPAKRGAGFGGRPSSSPQPRRKAWWSLPGSNR